ncbi:MAG: amino acid carrier protein [Clostridia bacterium]|nr:amino acid carrier protein [Clostridia bacterium]
MRGFLLSFESWASSAMTAALLFVSVYLCVKLRGFHLIHPIKTLRRAFSENGRGQLKALFMALGGTLGVGNIVGVALAIIYGGAGSVFWMWLSAILVMIIKYAEVVLAKKYRRKTPDGYEGGAMYYIEKGVKSQTLARIFGLLCILCAPIVGALIQANAISECVGEIFGKGQLLTAVAVALPVLFISIGGHKRISGIISAIVPVMSVLYIGMSVAVICYHFDSVPAVFERIFSEAFTFRSAVGGAVASAPLAIRYGVSRGMFSNEAGMGTAPMAHASADSSPTAQGIMGMIEVFVDTVFMCTLTALAILCVTDSYGGGNAMNLVIRAFSSVFGPSAGALVFVEMFFFAFATMILWVYYGQVAVRYFSQRKWIANAFTVIYCMTVIIGFCIDESYAWRICDLLSAAMTLINLFAIMKLSDEVPTI